ncbi:hypothetical protein [Paenibacillus sp. Marseille-Q7038]
MSYLCPLCNGLHIPAAQPCLTCGEPIVDYGLTEDYAGPYSPYVSSSDYLTIPEAKGYCIHLMFCPHCLTQTSYAVETWEVPGHIGPSNHEDL